LSTIDDAIIGYLKTGAGQPRLVRFLPARVLPRDGFIGIVVYTGVDNPPAPKMFYRLPDGRVTVLLAVGGGAIYHPEHPLTEHDLCLNCYNYPGATIKMLFDWPFKMPINAGCNLNPMLPLIQAGAIRLLADAEYLVGDSAFYTVQVTRHDYYYMYCYGIPVFEEAVVRSPSMLNKVDLSDSILAAMDIVSDGTGIGTYPVYLTADEAGEFLRVSKKLGIDVVAEWACNRCLVISVRGQDLCVERRGDYYVFTTRHCAGKYVGEPLESVGDIDGYIAWNQI